MENQKLTFHFKSGLASLTLNASLCSGCFSKFKNKFFNVQSDTQLLHI